MGEPWGVLEASWRRLGRLSDRLWAVLGRLGAVLGRFGARLGGVLGGSYAATSGVLGRLRASSKRLEPDYRTKLRRSIWDAIFGLIFFSILIKILYNSNTCKGLLVLQK